ncbi:MAG: hypothetical protein JWN44_3433 [Myxococcales bacterium]|nr:hypothetical protein [Myxococcales bacterium]
MDAAPALNAPKPRSPKRQPGNALPITALVFAALFFLPLVPTIGLILGVIALISGRSKAISIVAVSLGAFFTFMTGIYAAIAIPAFMKYIARAKSTEAIAQVASLGNAVSALDARHFAALADSQWTPAGSACAQPKQKFAADPTTWQAEPWKTLGFAVDRATAYQMRVTRNAQGFLVEARGDLDCDGKLSHFARQVTAEGVQPPEITDQFE